MNIFEDYLHYSTYSTIRNPSLNIHAKTDFLFFFKSQEKEQSTPPHVPSSWRRGYRGDVATVQMNIRY